MFCVKCGAELKEEAIYCSNCGTKVNGRENSINIKIPDLVISKKLFIENNAIKRYSVNKKTLSAIGVSIIAIIICVTVLKNMIIHSTPADVTMALLKSIKNNDKTLLMKCLDEKERVNLMLDAPHYASALRRANINMEEYYGSSWLDNVQARSELYNKEDLGQEEIYRVYIDLEGISESVYVIKDGNKYYVKYESLYRLLGELSAK